MTPAKNGSLTHWIFDLDGTLTLAVHDFDAIRDELGLPRGQGILEALDELPPAVAGPKHQRLDEIERELAHASRPQPGILRRLDQLHAAGISLGILTRNTRDNALASLAAIGAGAYFPPESVLGRDEAAFKPDPAGILALLGSWQAHPATALFAGDGRYDLLTGRAAGVKTLHFDTTGEFPFPEITDHRVTSWEADHPELFVSGR